MHPITALFTNQNASSQKLSMTTGHQPLAPMAIPTTINRHRDGIDSFQHFFETDLADLAKANTDTPASEPGISGNSERPPPSKTEVEVEDIATVHLAMDDQPAFDGIEAAIGQPQYVKIAPKPGALSGPVEDLSDQNQDQSYVDIPKRDMSKKSNRPSIIAELQDVPKLAPVKVTSNVNDHMRPHQSTAEAVIAHPRVIHQQQTLSEVTVKPYLNNETVILGVETPPAFTEKTTAQQLRITPYQPTEIADQAKFTVPVDDTNAKVPIRQSARLDQSKSPLLYPQPIPEQHVVRTLNIAKPDPHLSEMPQETGLTTISPARQSVSASKNRVPISTRFSMDNFQQVSPTNRTALPPQTTTPIQSTPLVSNPTISAQIHSDIAKSFVTEANIETSIETRPGSPAHQQIGTVRTELPIHIARQLAEVVQQMPSRPVDITLSPEELGRVRLSVATSEGGIVVNVFAERPETLDLMRRHIDQLSQEFQALGYHDIAFAFAGTGNGAAGDSNDTPVATRTETSDPEPDNASTKTTQIHISPGAAGLDLRL